MQLFKSKIQTQSEAFANNQSAMQTAVDQINQIIDQVEQTAEAKKAKYAQKNMLLPRHRLNLLLDANTSFIELSSLAGYKLFDDKDGSSAGAGSITGIGIINGIRCAIMVDNYAIKGGTITPIGLDKKMRLQEIAMQQRLPVIALSQSGGANLTYVADTFIPAGKSFANQARMSAMGLPQITVVHGSATAGGAYQPGLSDQIIMVKKQATMYLAGPPLLKAATGEVASDEALGGAQMHANTSGVCDHLAESDEDAIGLARNLVATLPFSAYSTSTRKVDPPKYDATELLGVVPANEKEPYDVKEIICRIADGSLLQSFKAEFDQGTECISCTIGGYPCGIIGNNGPITSRGANKAAQFIQLCEQNQTPILFIHNTTGFMVGIEAEESGIIKHGSKLIQAVANASVPKISLMVGGSYGAGNYAMCGRGFDPDFLFAWPNSKTAVMGSAQAGMVLRIVSEAKMQQQGKIDTQKLDFLEQSTQMMMDKTNSALATSAKLWDDGIIDPRDSRALLIELLSICDNKKQIKLSANTFGVARF